jgi:hypothetical protein
VGDGTSTVMILAIGICKNIISNKLQSQYNTGGTTTTLKITEELLNEFQTYTLDMIKETATTKVSKNDLYNYALLATRNKQISTEISNMVNKLPKGTRPTIEEDFIGMQKQTKYEVLEDKNIIKAIITIEIIRINILYSSLNRIYNPIDNVYKNVKNIIPICIYISFLNKSFIINLLYKKNINKN